MNHLSRHCIGILSGLAHVRHYLPSCTLKVLVTALVLSQVRYCLEELSPPCPPVMPRDTWCLGRQRLADETVDALRGVVECSVVSVCFYITSVLASFFVL